MISPRYILSTCALLSAMAAVFFVVQSDDPTMMLHSYAPDRTYKITFLQTNDILREQFHTNNSLAINERQTVIDSIREEVKNAGGEMILLSGGDISASIENAPPISLRRQRYQAMTVGLHQFDYPLSTIRKQQKKANFPLLSANIFESETGKPLFDAYTLLNVDGLDIAIMGLTDRAISNEIPRQNLAGITVLDPLEVAKELAPQLKEQADIVVASTHMGHNKNIAEELQSLASIDGIDLVLGDHTYPSNQSDAASALMNTFGCGEYISRIDIEFKNGQITQLRTQKIALNGVPSASAQLASYSPK